MKALIFGLSAIAVLSPPPAIAMPDPLNAPACYMVSPSGRMINLNYLCVGNNSQAIASQSPSSISASDVCRAFAADVLNAQNQFQRDQANEGLRFCLQNKDSIQNDINNGN